MVFLAIIGGVCPAKVEFQLAVGLAMTSSAVAMLTGWI